MPRLPYLTLFLLATLTCTGPTAEPSLTTPAYDEAVDAQAVRQLIQNVFDDIWSGTDTAYVRRYHTDDFLLLEHGEIWTNDTIRNYQLRKLANYDPTAPARKNSFEYYRMEQNGDEIWTAYQNYGDWVNAAGDTVRHQGWLESGVAVRTPEGWKLRLLHSTRQ